MRRPEMRMGRFICRYKQIPYDNRYFFVYFEGQEIAKIPRYMERHDLVYRLMDLGRDRRWETWYKFLERVEKYDKYLDEHND